MKIYSTGPHCGGTCCGRRRENELRAAVRRKLVSRAASSLRPIEDLLLTTRTTLQGTLTQFSMALVYLDKGCIEVGIY